MPFFKHEKQEIMEKYECDENLIPIFQIVENSIEMDYWLNKFDLQMDKKEKDKMTELEKKFEQLEYVLFEDYRLDQYMHRYYTPSEVRDFYNRASEEYKALLRQLVKTEKK